MKSYVCNHETIVDVGTGSGGFLRILLSICGLAGRILGLDIDCPRLSRARRALDDIGTVGLICGDASLTPIASSIAGAVSLAMTLHEIEESLVDAVLNEIWRILKPGGILFFFDRVLFEPKTPAEELVILTENAYHKAVEYALGVKYWGLRTSEEYLSRIQERGFKLLEIKKAKGKHLDGKTFLESWGKDTQRLLGEIEDYDEKKELESLIRRIREQGVQHGYGPAVYVVAVFRKPP